MCPETILLCSLALARCVVHIFLGHFLQTGTWISFIKSIYIGENRVPDARPVLHFLDTITQNRGVTIQNRDLGNWSRRPRAPVGSFVVRKYESITSDKTPVRTCLCRDAINRIGIRSPDRYWIWSELASDSTRL